MFLNDHGRDGGDGRDGGIVSISPITGSGANSNLSGLPLIDI